jgi:AcrR family transcriptional regulator
MERRKYTLKQRAERQAQTRERIVGAAMALHEELGPRDTTVSAIAERAGVQRLTVYRHFPDEAELFVACTSRWLVEHPPPDPSAWPEADARARTQAALQAFYRYYGQTQRMWQVSYRDEQAVPALKRQLDKFHHYLDEVRDDLLVAWALPARQAAMARATIGHCLRFATWVSLVAEGLDEAQMGDLAAGWVTCAAGGGHRV